jgi:hypothetical protein
VCRAVGHEWGIVGGKSRKDEADREEGPRDANGGVGVDSSTATQDGDRKEDSEAPRREDTTTSEEDLFTDSHKRYFDRLLVADCLWMPWQHVNLMKSIRHFLSPDGKAWVVAGFHTGRPKMAGFYDEAVLAEQGLEIETIWERDAEDREREWVVDRGVEDVTARKRWLVIAVLRRKAGVM